MLARSSTSKLIRFSSVAALCLSATPARAQSAGAGGAGNGGMSSGGMANGGAGDGGAGVSNGGAGASSGGGGMSDGGAGAGAGMSGMSSGGAGQGGITAAGAGGESAGAAGSGAGAGGANLVSNGKFDTTDTSPWWGYANDTTDDPADETLAVTNGQLCATMTAAGKNVWDVIVGLSGVSLLPNQYYHVAFSVTSDTDRTIKFKTGFGDAPYTDYFIEPVQLTAATPQMVDYTYLNLRTDAAAQFQFQIGKTPGTVCVDDIVLEPVPAPATPAYTTAAPSGHPFKDYKAIVKMGTAVDTPIFLSNPLHDAIVAGEFSMITPANSMKMNIIQPTQGVFDYTDTDALVAWAQTNGLEVHGHPLVWHTQTPSWLTDGTFDRDQMIAIMYAQIDGLMGHYVGKFPYWDVVNEAVDSVNGAWTYRSTVWHDRIGDDFMDLAFTHARATDANAKLLYNDYNIEQKGNAKADYVFNMVSSMKTRGIPIDAIGFQSHYYVEPDGSTANGVPNMQAIRDNMARYAEIGVEVHVTECDFRIGKPLDDTKTELQKKFFADLLQVCIDAPNCSHFTVWGLSDLDSWVPTTFAEYDYAHIFDKALAAKPAYFAMSQVFSQYDPNSMPMGTGGTAGSAGSAGSAGVSAGGSAGSSAAGTAGSSAAGGSPTGSGSQPRSSERKSGCSLGSPASESSPWALGVFAALGVVLYRRRSSARAAQRQRRGPTT